MEKTGYNPNYPQMPPQMASDGIGQMAQMSTAPPSYDQATGSGAPTAGHPYPPVQVLPPGQPTANAQPMNATHRHNPPNVQSGGIHVGQPTYQGGVGPQNMPHMMQQQPVIVIQQQAIIPLGPEPALVTCPSCQKKKLTRIEHDPSSKTHLMAALLCILGFWCCVCLPYCAGSCMNTNHYCGHCNKFLGTYGGNL